MNRKANLKQNPKALIGTVLALAALGAATSAQARADVGVFVGIHAPPAYVQPAPVYVQPQPVYVVPQPAVVQYGGGSRHRGRGGPWGDADRDGVPNAYDRQSRFYDHRAARRAGWGDRDGDGVPNRWDQAPRNPYYR